MLSHVGRPRVIRVLLVAAMVLALWQVSIALAQAPQPNALAPVPGGPASGSVPSVDLSTNGPAAAIHGDPGAGRLVFARNCASCHGDRGTGNIPNPGSNDGTVPGLNPIDPGFYAEAQGDPGAFARELDLFVQHGSRPAGDAPQDSMPAWGDQKLLSPPDLANAEAYIMQLNGVYWPDRWAPPAEVRIETTRNGNLVMYQITIVNHGSSTLGNLDLSDTLPAGLSYVTSYLPDPGQNPGKVVGSTVSWNNGAGVPQGGTLGPFVLTAQILGSQVPPNFAALRFSWASADGTSFWSSAVSDPAVPKQPAVSKPPTTTVNTPPPLVTSAPTMTPMPTVSGVATSVPATSVPVAPTATLVPAPAAPASFAVQIVQPGTAASTWGYSPATITIHVGDTVTWTNAGPLAHTVTADDGSFDSGLFNVGESWSMTFTSDGTFTYFCTPHPWMKGTVIVRSAG